MCIGNHRAQLEDPNFLSAKTNSLLAEEWFTWRVGRNDNADNRNGNSKNHTDNQREADVEKTLERKIDRSTLLGRSDVGARPGSNESTVQHVRLRLARRRHCAAKLLVHARHARNAVFRGYGTRR